VYVDSFIDDITYVRDVKISYMNAGLLDDCPYTKKLEHIGILIVFRSIVYVIIEMRLKEMYCDVHIICYKISLNIITTSIIVK
jgi:hypothetical protein